MTRQHAFYHLIVSIPITFSIKTWNKVFFLLSLSHSNAHKSLKISKE